jgi:hypothetical protein
VVKIFTPPLREAGKLLSTSEAEILRVVTELLPLIKPEAIKCDV